VLIGVCLALPMWLTIGAVLHYAMRSWVSLAALAWLPL
jgi:hypothetical protein